MKPKMNRRSFLRRAFSSLMSLIGLSGGTYYYAKHLEPYMLTTKRENLVSTKIPNSFNDFTILQFSDTHIGFHYSLNELRKLVTKINSLKPDIILFTGDLIDSPDKYSKADFEALIAVLQKLRAHHGKFWIYGNHDHGGYGTEKIRSVMELSGFGTLKNATKTIMINNEAINLVGLDDVMLGRPNIEQALHHAHENVYTIMMCHEPDYAINVKLYPVDVQLSGHSHGGQIRLPIIGHLVTPPLGNQFVDGHYQIGDYPLNLYVSRGIGTTRLPYRFMCKPEITLFTLKGTEKIV